MALNKAQLAADIKAAFTETKLKETDPDIVFGALADSISNAIDSYVKQIMITYVTGLTAPNGLVGGSFGYKIS